MGMKGSMKMTPEQRQRQADAMRKRWADPEFRKAQTKRLRKAAKMATTKKGQTRLEILDKEAATFAVRRVDAAKDDPVYDQISVRLSDLKATHSLSSLVGVTDANWFNQTIPVPATYRVAHVILEPIK
jgi:hypothetical protein